MWKDRHGLSKNRLLSIGDWLAAFGLIPFIIAAIYNEGRFARPLLASVAGICFIVVIASLYRATTDVWNRDTTKLSQINEHKSDMNRFLSSRFSNLYLRNDQQVDIEVEWFNQTLFDLLFESAHDGTIKINELERKVTSNDKRSCSPSRVCSYTITLTDKDIVELIRDSISKTKPVKLFLTFFLGGIVYYERDGKPDSSRPFDVQAKIDTTVIPQKV